MPPPYATVVIPTRNRPGPLHACLQALSRLDYPRARLRVVVVDDGSDVPPRGVVDAWKDRLPVRLVVQPPSGPAVARNRGAAAAEGELLAFTDDDCLPQPGWLAALAEGVTPDRAVGGETVNALDDDPYARASQALIRHLYDYYGAAAGRPRFLTSNNLAVDAAAFRDVGGFDERLPRAAAEDREFCDRWLASGRVLAFAAEAVVRHAHAMDLASFWRQHFNYGRGALYFHRARARRGGGPLRLEPPAFYADLLRRPLRERSRGPWRTTALLALAQAANALGFAWEAALEGVGLGSGAGRPRPA